MAESALERVAKALAWADGSARIFPIARVTPVAAHLLDWARFHADPSGYRPRSGPGGRDD